MGTYNINPEPFLAARALIDNLLINSSNDEDLSPEKVYYRLGKIKGSLKSIQVLLSEGLSEYAFDDVAEFVNEMKVKYTGVGRNI